jgi:hypothetical protein
LFIGVVDKRRNVILDENIAFSSLSLSLSLSLLFSSAKTREHRHVFDQGTAEIVLFSLSAEPRDTSRKIKRKRERENE